MKDYFDGKESAAFQKWISCRIGQSRKPKDIDAVGKFQQWAIRILLLDTSCRFGLCSLWARRPVSFSSPWKGFGGGIYSLALYQ